MALKEYAKKAGLQMEDAKHHMNISVTTDDVAKAKRKDSMHCAFAEALVRQRPGAVNAFFFRSLAYVETATKLTRYILPPSVRLEVASFDRSGIMDPGVYQLSAPTKADKMGAASKRAKRSKSKSKGASASGSRDPAKPKKLIHRTGLIRELGKQAVK